MSASPFKGRIAQAADALSQLRTNGTDRTPSEDKVPYSAYAPPIPEKPEAGALYVQYYDAFADSESIGISEVYTIATPTATKHAKRPVAAQGSVHEQAKDLYCRRSSYTG